MNTYYSDCIDCKNRVVGCHSYCKSYLQGKILQQQDNKKKEKMREYNRSWHEYMAAKHIYVER